MNCETGLTGTEARSISIEARYAAYTGARRGTVAGLQGSTVAGLQGSTGATGATVAGLLALVLRGM